MAYDLRKVIVLGVAGNFAGHLEQAVKNIQFDTVQADDPNAPKGLFPVYVPSETGRIIETFPISANHLVIPYKDAALKIEPEVALLCRIAYDGESVSRLMPEQFTAYNDCSIHNKDVTKISEKKNWGTDSKGVSFRFIEIDQFNEDGIMNGYRLACYLLRNGKLHAYGVESSLREYNYFYSRLVDWLIEKMNSQTDSDPFESISTLLKEAKFPKYALIGIGSTRYTDYGEVTYLMPGDECLVIVYDTERYDTQVIEQSLLDGNDEGAGLSVLRQAVVQI